MPATDANEACSVGGWGADVPRHATPHTGVLVGVAVGRGDGVNRGTKPMLRGLMGGEPLWPKLRLSGLKSLTFTKQSPEKSARLSYGGFPQPKPNDGLRILKSVMLTALSSLASPVFINPISSRVIGAPEMLTDPESA